MIVLDTNVISELMRPQPEPRVLVWADGLDPGAVAITTMNEAEILHGIARPGRPMAMAMADAVVAATALARRAQLATRDDADFADVGLELINPWNTP